MEPPQVIDCCLLNVDRGNNGRCFNGRCNGGRGHGRPMR